MINKKPYIRIYQINNNMLAMFSKKVKEIYSSENYYYIRNVIEGIETSMVTVELSGFNPWSHESELEKFADKEEYVHFREIR